MQVPPHKCQEKLLQATRSIISLLRERDSLLASLGTREGGPLEVKCVGEGEPLEVKGVGEGPLDVKEDGNSVSQEGLSNCKESSGQDTRDVKNPVGQTEGGQAQSSSKDMQQAGPQQLPLHHDSLSSLRFSESEIDCQRSSQEPFLLLTDDILSTSPDHQAHPSPSLTPG